MKQAQFKNVTGVAIGGKPAGSTFFLPVLEDGSPDTSFWRKRVADQSIVAVEVPAPAPKKSSSAKADEAAKKGN